MSGLFLLLSFITEIPVLNANSVDPDQNLRFAKFTHINAFWINSDITVLEDTSISKYHRSSQTAHKV